jgi:hypothetical protein
MKYKNIIKLRLPQIQLLAVVPTQLKFSIVKDHDEPTILLFETLFCTWECFNMGTELPTKVMLGQTLVLMQMTFLNNVRNVGSLVLSRTSCENCPDSCLSDENYNVLDTACVLFRVTCQDVSSDVIKSKIMGIFLFSVNMQICKRVCFPKRNDKGFENT